MSYLITGSTLRLSWYIVYSSISKSSFTCLGGCYSIYLSLFKNCHITIKTLKGNTFLNIYFVSLNHVYILWTVTKCTKCLLISDLIKFPVIQRILLLNMVNMYEKAATCFHKCSGNIKRKYTNLMLREWIGLVGSPDTKQIPGGGSKATGCTRGGCPFSTLTLWREFSII